jgi:hypothetical protein
MNYRIDKEEIWSQNKLQSTKYVIKYLRVSGAFKGWRSLKYKHQNVSGSSIKTLYFNTFNQAEAALKKILNNTNIDNIESLLEYEKV